MSAKLPFLVVRLKSSRRVSLPSCKVGGVSTLTLRLNRALRGFDDLLWLGVWLPSDEGISPVTSDSDDCEKIRPERLEVGVVGVVLAEVVNSSAGGDRSTSGLRQI